MTPPPEGPQSTDETSGPATVAGATTRAVGINFKQVRIDISESHGDYAAGAQVSTGPSTVRVAVVVPCYNRPRDVQTLMADLARITPHAGGVEVDLRVVLVDNCSDEPLATISLDRRLRVEHLRLSRNTGGSGGYNAGMLRALGVDEELRPIESSPWRTWNAEYVWLVDSDARVAPDTLAGLLNVLQADASIVAAGAAVRDPDSDQCFEIAGRINRRSGIYEPVVGGAVGVRGLVEGEYVAAACALVRADAVRDVGVMPDRFINGDDVEWFIRLAQATGGRIVGVPWASAWHPRFDRFPTWQRYYTTRNALAPLAALGLSRRVRFARALRDVCRAAQQEVMQRPDLAALHMSGLRDAALGDPRGAARAGMLKFEPSVPISRIGVALRESQIQLKGRKAYIAPGDWLSPDRRERIANALRELGCKVFTGRAGATGEGCVRASAGAAARVVRPSADIAIVPARGRPQTWCRGHAIVQVAGDMFVLKRARPISCTLAAATTLAKGVPLAWRASGAADPGPIALNLDYASDIARDGPGRTMSLEIIVLSYNRWSVLEATLRRLLADAVLTGSDDEKLPARTITVVDNGSTDGTPPRVREQFPQVKLIALPNNHGVQAFNDAASASTAEALLILDDDAVPDTHALTIAIDRLARDPSLGAVTLLPRHPRTRLSEWPFAEALRGSSTDLWPVMGCANLVRRSAWNAVDGYEPSFFLYRNDADLALKLLGSGFGVHFDPALIVWHDSAAGPNSRKSPRWHQLATRNWIWMARRHGRGPWAIAGALAGWLHAHRLARLSPALHWATFRGAWSGLATRPAPLAASTDGTNWERFIRLRLTKKV